MTLEDAHDALRRFKPTPDKLKGLRGTNQDIYDQLILGTTITKAIEGDSKSYSFRTSIGTIRTTMSFTSRRRWSLSALQALRRRCDIVCFVNGIPFIVIENKRPTESLKKAEVSSSATRTKTTSRTFSIMPRLLLSMRRQEARYATVGTPRKFWQIWRDEEDRDADIFAASIAR